MLLEDVKWSFQNQFMAVCTILDKCKYQNIFFQYSFSYTHLYLLIQNAVIQIAHCNTSQNISICDGLLIGNKVKASVFDLLRLTETRYSTTTNCFVQQSVAIHGQLCRLSIMAVYLSHTVSQQLH